MTVIVHRGADAVTMPWRNGGGVTHEIVRRPSGVDFGWRVSVAEVAVDAPFSAFDDHDRIIVLLSGPGMDLHLVDSGATVELRPPFGWYRFSGSTRIEATLPDGPTTDLNLMWRRDQFDATVRRFVAPFDLAPQTGATLLAVAVDGSPLLDGATVLARGDVVECPDILHIDGSGTVLVFALVPR